MSINTSPVESGEAHRRTPVVMPESATRVDLHCLIGPHVPSELGQFLDPAHHAPFDHPRLGEFNSQLGYWYWSVTGAKYEAFRELSGAEVVRVARSSRFVYGPGGARRISLYEGLVEQLKTYPAMKKLFVASKHRYSFPTDSATMAQYTFPLSDEFNWTNPIPMYLEVLNDLARDPHALKSSRR